LITWILFGEDYRSLTYSLCNFLQSPVISSLLSLNILLSTLFSNTLSLCYSLKISRKLLKLNQKTNYHACVYKKIVCTLVELYYLWNTVFVREGN
jgi:hypothetical protein